MYGFPIYEYYQKARMQAAQDKLLTRKFSVKEVAMELGYANLSNFTIAFKKNLAYCPVSYCHKLETFLCPFAPLTNPYELTPTVKGFINQHANG